MNDLKLYTTNVVAWVLTVSKVLPWLQLMSISLAIVYTLISIYKKIK